MPTLTTERPSVSSAATSTPQTPSSSLPHLEKGTQRKIVLVGFDLGTNKSCILAGSSGSGDIAVSKVIPSVVGYVKEGIVDGIIAGNSRLLFGDQAIQNGLHVNAVSPIADGVVAHPTAARDFFLHIRSLADPSGQAEIRGVIGVPAGGGSATGAGSSVTWSTVIGTAAATRAAAAASPTAT
ncbi:MAG TPA: hypothetical protein PLV87_01865, partial [Opitutaceae bacterium]|nr:hypothetical protein [Opitutaceae bacterium]